MGIRIGRPLGGRKRPLLDKTVMVTARLRRNLSQREVGEKIGASRSAVNAWEQGLNGPDDESLRALARVLGVSEKRLRSTN